MIEPFTQSSLSSTIFSLDRLGYRKAEAVGKFEAYIRAKIQLKLSYDQAKVRDSALGLRYDLKYRVPLYYPYPGSREPGFQSPQGPPVLSQVKYSNTK